MARKLTLQDLLEQGVPEAQAKRIIEKLTTPKPREIAWVFKATEAEAAKVVLAVQNLGGNFAHFTVTKRFHAQKEEAPAKK